MELRLINYFINKALKEKIIDNEISDNLKDFANYLDENLELVGFYFDKIENKKIINELEKGEKHN